MNSIRMINLPFPHYFFDDVKATPKDPYESIESLIESYELNFDTFKAFMIRNKAVMAGSSVLRILLNNRVNYIPGDMDIWLQLNSNNSNNKDFMKYLLTYGYSIDTSTMFPFSMNTLGISDGQDESEYESSNILHVVTFVHSKINKKIQLVFTRFSGIDFVKTSFDISMTGSYWYPASDPVKIIPYDYGHLYRLEFYICNQYTSYIDLPDSNRKKQKLMNRIKKYEERGFTLIKDPIACLNGFDPRMDSNFLKGDAHEIISSDTTPISVWLRDYNNILVYLTKDSIHAVNRKELYDYIEKNNKTYWGHKISVEAAQLLLYADYTVYTVDKVHPEATSYILGCYTVLRSIYKKQMFEIDYEKKEKMNNMRIYMKMESNDLVLSSYTKNMNRQRNLPPVESPVLQESQWIAWENHLNNRDDVDTDSSTDSSSGASMDAVIEAAQQEISND
jgi:hypothetical protein